MERKEEIKQKERLRNKRIRNKLERKNLYLIKFRKEMDKQYQLKKIQNETILKERKFKINQLLDEQNSIRELKRKEIDKKNDAINNFINEKEIS